MRTRFAAVACVLAALTVLGVESRLLGYRETVQWSDHAAIAAAAVPYLILAWVAWDSPPQQPLPPAVRGAALVLAAGGFCLVAVEWYSYYQAITSSPRGARYLAARYQRVAVFLVCVVQWLAAAAFGIVRLSRRSGPPRSDR